MTERAGREAARSGHLEFGFHRHLAGKPNKKKKKRQTVVITSEFEEMK